MPDWDHMKHALAVGRCGTISGAAKKLKVDHTTVGRKLAALEDEFGNTLFVREARRLEPTDAGRAVIEAAERMEAAMLDLERTLAARSETPTGVVRVATSEAFANVIVSCLPGLRDQHPDLRLEVLAGNRAVDLTRGEADLAVRHKKTDQPTLISKKILELDWAVFASEDYIAKRGRPEGTGPMPDHYFIGFEERLARAPGANWVSCTAEPDQIVMRGDSILAVRGAAVAGVGIAAIPAFLAFGEPTLVRVLEERIGRGSCWLVVHEDLKNAPHVRVAMDYIETYLRGRAGELGATEFGLGRTAH